MSRNSEYKIVSTSVAPIYNNSTFSSEIINQALFWEELVCIDVKENWHKVKQRDGYIGWVHSFYIVNSCLYDKSPFLKETNAWYFVAEKFTDITLKDKNSMSISFGSLIPCVFIENQFKVLMPNGDYGAINENSLVKMNSSLTFAEIISLAKCLLNIPYLWGGRSSFGFDCSGFVQLLLSFLKVDFPRDTKDQIKFKDMFVVNNNFKLGDIVFFSKNNILNHVGIFIDDNEFIHSSGYVRINSINPNSKLYDDTLFSMIHSVNRLNIINE